MKPLFEHIGIVGAGAMGRGIAQIAAQAGSTVLLFDTAPGATQAAVAALQAQWQSLASKTRISASDVEVFTSRIHQAASLQELATCPLVIEAVAERMDIKTQLLQTLESCLDPTAILASNTSSLSITALGAGLQRPTQLAGFHFFNPVPLMKVVEVIPGLKTAPHVVQALQQYAKDLGHTPVLAQDTPGFIVNHAGRGYGTEALRIASEGVADFATIDRILRDQCGFKLGPFELMDLTGLDVSHPVMESIYQQYYEEPRYRPSVLTAQRLAGGLTGRKAGEGFYKYTDGQPMLPAEPSVPVVEEMPPVWLSPRASRRVELLMLLKNLGAKIETGQSPSPQALTLVAPLGFDITTVKHAEATAEAASRAAGAGVPVAKHGNRAASSKAGAADTLEALGLDLARASAKAEMTLAEIGIAFFFAQAHHPALGRIAPIRKSLGRPPPVSATLTRDSIFRA